MFDCGLVLEFALAVDSVGCGIAKFRLFCFCFLVWAVYVAFVCCCYFGLR